MWTRYVCRAGRALLGASLAVGIAGAAPTLAADGAAWCGKLASMQNRVETRAVAAQDWAPSTLNQMLFARDRVRTGEGSRAAILYTDQTLHRINEKSEVEVTPPEAGNPGVLRVISGQHYFSSRRPKDYGRIETPTVTAAIRGTEFVVDVDAAGATTITMIEGVVEASNEMGSLSVSAGEAAYVEPGKAPVKRIVVRPRDAVAWSLYYPRVLGGKDAVRLQQMSESGQDLSHAAELLASGQVGAAGELIARARERNPGDPLALAMASVIEVASDRKQEGLDLARRAVEADPESSAAALAMSFASQADFDIAEARKAAENAARLDPDSAEAQARVAELRMAEGDIEGAQEAAERATRRDPDSVRALAVLGFVQLAELRTAEARGTFERAVALDPAFPLARLGLGIARVRTDLPGGREEMQTAVLLDPENSLFRSYLAKAYYEERRPDAAEKELASAKQLDPSDPTPYLYSALVKRSTNRPVEALHQLDRSIELNDQRAVYRSRLMLDQDLAVRSADLAGIYNELGFDQLGQVTARRSADQDQSNFSSHLALAGTYRESPGYAPAFLSEQLQGRIYQPVNTNAVRPDVINESPSFNEYTSLISRNRMRGFAGLAYGDTDTDMSEYYPEGFQCPDPSGALRPCELGSSNPSSGDLTLTLNRDRFAGAVSYSAVQTDGFRVNSDVDQRWARGYFAFAPTYRDQVQLSVINGKRETGDLPLRDVPAVYSPQRIETDLTNVGVGYHRILSPSSDLAVSATYNDAQQDLDSQFFGTASTAKLTGPQLEAQYVKRGTRVTWTAGAGHFDGEQEVSGTRFGFPPFAASGDDTFSNGYLYAKVRGLGPVEVSAGLVYEDVLAPVGLLPPRDAQIGAADVAFEDNKVSPKVGVSVHATSSTVIRAAAYERLNPAIGRLQTLEPTQVAGFNQFFDDPGGTSSRNYGLGLDQRVSHNFYFGLSALNRDLEIPEPFCDAPDPLFGCIGQTATTLVARGSDDWLGNVYVNGTVAQRVALSLDYAYEERDFDFTQVSIDGSFGHYLETQRTRPQVRVFLPMGLFAHVRSSYYDQQVEQFDPVNVADFTIDSEFWITDVSLGYRMPRRWGTVQLDVLNVGDREFAFYRSSLEETVVPARTVLLSVDFNSP